MRKVKIKMAQKAAWENTDTGYESMPLACGYLKAMVYSDEYIKKNVDIDICNFNGSATIIRVVREMFFGQNVDIACFSIFGWSYNLFGNVADTYKQLNPNGWVIFGGTHVTNQADKVFRTFPCVDIIINGEGELTYCEVIKAYLSGKKISELGYIKGISFRDENNQIVNTQPRERIEDLSIIPSPFLTGAIELTDEKGNFKYDVALMETNRGCPYKCGYCFWGGATGQRIYDFPLERLKEEVECFAQMKVRDICLCDSNFGLTKHDEEFFEILIKTREKYGYPNSIITSWAKNKGEVFTRILQRMKETKFITSFSISLQSLSEPVLKTMGRVNMKGNDWKEIARDLTKNGFDVYGELIWGLPEESSESFLKGYDILAGEVPRIAVYPHLLIPNTKYSEEKEKFGIVGWKAGKDDFEYVLKHNTMSITDNLKMHRFIFWVRLLVEYSLLKYIWLPLRRIENITQSQVILNFDCWIEKQNNDVCKSFRNYRDDVVKNLDAYRIEDALHYFFKTDSVKDILWQWWNEEIIPSISEEYKSFFIELMYYDILTIPIYGSTYGEIDESEDNIDGYKVEYFNQQLYYVKESVELKYDDLPMLVQSIINDDFSDIHKEHVHKEDIYFKVGFSNYIANHEFYSQYIGVPETILKDLTLV